MTAKHLLDEIVRGLDGVTAGPWDIKEETGWDEAWCDWHDVGPFSLMGPKADANSKHIARCSPDAIREIAAYVRDLEERLAKAAEALEQIADLTARCEHDGGFDREIGPIGCNLGDKCLCIGLHPIARTALSQIRSEK